MLSPTIGQCAAAWQIGCKTKTVEGVALEGESAQVPQAKHAEATLISGAYVQLQDLISRPHLNGRKGTLLEFNKDVGRWNVLMEDGSGLCLKPQNLVLHSETDGEQMKKPWAGCCRNIQEGVEQHAAIVQAALDSAHKDTIETFRYRPNCPCYVPKANEVQPKESATTRILKRLRKSAATPPQRCVIADARQILKKTRRLTAPGCTEGEVGISAAWKDFPGNTPNCKGALVELHGATAADDELEAARDDKVACDGGASSSWEPIGLGTANGYGSFSSAAPKRADWQAGGSEGSTTSDESECECEHCYTYDNMT